MNQITACPQCRQSVQIPETLMGKNVKCPLCGTAFVASPQGGYSSAPLPPSPPPGPSLEPYSPDPYASRSEPYSAPPPYPEPRRAGFPEREPYGERDDYYGRRHMEPHRGATVLTLGILGLVVCGILGIVAWAMGSTDLAKMRQGRMDPEGEGMTRAGQICGIIATIFIILGVVLFFVIIAAAPRGLRGF